VPEEKFDGRKKLRNAVRFVNVHDLLKLAKGMRGGRERKAGDRAGASSST